MNTWTRFCNYILHTLFSNYKCFEDRDLACFQHTSTETKLNCEQIFNRTFQHKKTLEGPHLMAKQYLNTRKAQILLGYSKEMTYHTVRQDLLCFHNSDPTTILKKKNQKLSSKWFVRSETSEKKNSQMHVFLPIWVNDSMINFRYILRTFFWLVNNFLPFCPLHVLMLSVKYWSARITGRVIN